MDTLAKRLGISALPGNLALYHASNDTMASWEELQHASSTHPVKLYAHGSFMEKLQDSHGLTPNYTLHLWHEESPAENAIRRFHFVTHPPFPSDVIKRQSRCQQFQPPVREVDLGEGVTACDDEVSTGPDGNPNYPTGWYYGWDTYGTAAQATTWDDDLGTAYPKENGFVPAMEALGFDFAKYNAWDECVCMQTNNGQWISTGSIQMTWNGGYNGYSPCWNPNCNGFL